LARPNGNATGFNDYERTIGTKWLEMLKEVAPNVTRMLVLHSDSLATTVQLPPIQAVEASLSAKVILANVRTASEVEQTLDAYSSDRNIGLIVLPNSINQIHRQLIINRAAQYRFPAIYPNRLFTIEGGLMSYGIDKMDQYRGAARYINRILNGEGPGELPIQQPTKFELIVNLKTAKAIALKVPETFLLRADEVIE
jgi:putative ABC transport system substrate-binding protein